MMQLRWVDERPLADREMIAKLYSVSVRTVRRYCTPIDREPFAGRRPGVGGRAFYDALTAAEELAGVVPRAHRVAAALVRSR